MLFRSNLKQSEAAYRQAIALIRQNQSALYPTIGYTGVTQQTSSGGGVRSTTGTVSNSVGQFSAGSTLSWEIDLWGRVARSVEAAEAVAQSAEESRRGVLVSAIAEIARTYVQLRGTQSLLAIARDNLTTAQQSLALTQQRAAGEIGRAHV